MTHQDIMNEWIVQMGGTPLDGVVWLGRYAYLVGDGLGAMLRVVAHHQIRSIGVFLGHVQSKKFVAAVSMIRILKDCGVPSIRVNEHAAWLVVCKRDVFKSGVIGDIPSVRYVIVCNRLNEPLGLGELVTDATIAVRVVMDVGDYLRRELS